jgi:hypothetical protein
VHSCSPAPGAGAGTGAGAGVSDLDTCIGTCSSSDSLEHESRSESPSRHTYGRAVGAASSMRTNASEPDRQKRSMGGDRSTVVCAGERRVLRNQDKKVVRTRIASEPAVMAAPCPVPVPVPVHFERSDSEQRRVTSVNGCDDGAISGSAAGVADVQNSRNWPRAPTPLLGPRRAGANLSRSENMSSSTRLVLLPSGSELSSVSVILGDKTGFVCIARAAWV